MTKKTNPPSLDQIIDRYQLHTIFPASCLDQLEIASYAPGEAICQQGEEQVLLPYLLEGHLTIIHSLENGIDTVLQTQDHPGLVGEIELILNRVCISSVIAAEVSTVVQLRVAAYRELLLTDPTFLIHTSRTLAEKLHFINHSTPTHMHYSVKERLASHLLTLAEKSIPGEGFSLPLTQLASNFGVSYRHLMRVIRELLDEGLIAREKRRYQVLDPDGLRQYQIDQTTHI